MALIIPPKRITDRWSEALRARLRRAPLEEFLAFRALKVTRDGVARDSDNLSRATVFIVESGLKSYFQEREDGLAETHHAVVGHTACLVSYGLAALILEPASWRVPALVSAAQLLRPWIGLNAAALVSASVVHSFTAGLLNPSARSAADEELTDSAAAAVRQNDTAKLSDAASMISCRLAHPGNQLSPAMSEPSAKSRAQSQL